MKDDKPSSDRRRHPRARILVPVQYRLINKSAEVEQILAEHKSWDQGQTKTLSKKGILLVAKEFLKKQSLLKVELELPSPKPQRLKAYAEVVWCRESEDGKGQYDVGINFLNVKEEEEDFLNRYVAALLDHKEEKA